MRAWKGSEYEGGHRVPFFVHWPAARVPAGADWLQRLAEKLDLLATPEQHGVEGIETDTFTISRFGDHTRAFLKVQDGCDIGCSFCIIPQLRKEPRDKAIDDSVREAAALTTAGYREIVVTGVSVGLYGREHGSSLAELLRHLVTVPGIGRIAPGELPEAMADACSGKRLRFTSLTCSAQLGLSSHVAEPGAAQRLVHQRLDRGARRRR